MKISTELNFRTKEASRVTDDALVAENILLPLPERLLSLLPDATFSLDTASFLYGSIGIGRDTSLEGKTCRAAAARTHIGSLRFREYFKPRSVINTHPLGRGGRPGERSPVIQRECASTNELSTHSMQRARNRRETCSA